MEDAKLLVVVDIQNDFIDGVLGTPEAQSIIPSVIEKIKNWDGCIIATADNHNKEYYDRTIEGKSIPFHCSFEDTSSAIQTDVYNTLIEHPNFLKIISKSTFGTTDLNDYICNYMWRYQLNIVEVQFIGLCTDICVLSNAIIMRANNPTLPISVDASCCAGTTPKNHQKALDIMKLNCIEIINN